MDILETSTGLYLRPFKYEESRMQNLLLGNIPSHERLQLSLPNYGIITDTDKKFVTFGSCFASSVSRGLWRLGFDTYFSEDVCFHYSPNSIKQYLAQLEYSKEEINELAIKLDDNKLKSIATRHSSQPGESSDAFIQKLYDSNQDVLERLKNTDYVVMTFGNATYQKHLDSGLTLCHGGGLPKNLFEVVKSPYEEVLLDTKACIDRIKAINPACTVILTVSPQRYGWLMNANLSTGINEILDLDKDSATNWVINSNIDKAKLRLAIDNIISENSVSNLHYFPSFEIVMDELRDYEGFNHDVKDLMHVNMPNTPNYVINKFLNSFCSKELKSALEFFRTTLDILIDIYPSRLKKMSYEQAELYLQEKLPLVSYHLDSVKCDKLVKYALNGMNQAFPEQTRHQVNTLQLLNLNPYLLDKEQDKLDKINALTDQEICIVGTSPLLDRLCKSSYLLSKKVTKIISRNNPAQHLYGIPITSHIDTVLCEEPYFLIIEDDVHSELQALGKLNGKNII